MNSRISFLEHPFETEQEYLDSFLQFLPLTPKEAQREDKRNFRFEVMQTIETNELMVHYNETMNRLFLEEYKKRTNRGTPRDTFDIEQIKNDNLLPWILAQRYWINWNNRPIRCFLPKHIDKTASFSVTKDQKHFHCFWCWQSGSVLDLLMIMEGKTFIDSLKELWHP